MVDFHGFPSDSCAYFADIVASSVQLFTSPGNITFKNAADFKSGEQIHWFPEGLMHRDVLQLVNKIQGLFNHQHWLLSTA